MKPIGVLCYSLLALCCPTVLVTDAMRAADDVFLARLQAKIERVAEPGSGCRWAELRLAVLRTVKGEPGAFVTAAAPNQRCMCTLGLDLSMFEQGKEFAVFIQRQDGANLVLYASALDREPWMAFLTPVWGSKPVTVAARLANRIAERFRTLTSDW